MGPCNQRQSESIVSDFVAGVQVGLPPAASAQLDTDSAGWFSVLIVPGACAKTAFRESIWPWGERGEDGVRGVRRSRRQTQGSRYAVVPSAWCEHD